MADEGQWGGFLNLAAGGNGGAPAVGADEDPPPPPAPAVVVDENPPPLGGDWGLALALPADVWGQGPPPPAPPLGGYGGLALALPADVWGQGPPPVAAPLGGHGGLQALALPADVWGQGPPPPAAPLGGHGGLQALALNAVVGVQGPPPPAAPLGGHGGLQALALHAVVGFQGPPPQALGQQKPGVGRGDMVEQTLGELLDLAELKDKLLDEPEASVTTAETREELSRTEEEMKQVIEQALLKMPMVNPPPPVVRQSGDTPLFAAGDIPAAPPVHLFTQSAPPAYVLRRSATAPFVPDPPPVRPPVALAHPPFGMMGGAAPAAGIGPSVMPLVAAGSDDPIMPPQFAGMEFPVIINPPQPLKPCKACGERLQWLNQNHGDTKPPHPLQPHYCLCEPCQKFEKKRVKFCRYCREYDARNPKPPGNL